MSLKAVIAVANGTTIVKMGGNANARMTGGHGRD